MKTLLLADPIDDQRAGIHTYCTQLVQCINQSKYAHHFSIVKKKKWDNKTTFQALQNAQFSTPIFKLLRNCFTLPRIAKKIKADVVIEPAHYGPYNLPSSIKRVTVLHDLSAITHPHLHPAISHWAHKYFVRSALRKSHAVIVPSHYSKNELVNWSIEQEKIHVLPLGVHSDYLTDPDSENSHSGLQSPYFHMVGTIEPRKGILTALKAFEIFKATGAPHQLVLVGQLGWKYSEIKKAIQNHPYKEDIQLTGFLTHSEIKQIHQNSCALLFPSEFEGFGLPIIEAQASSCRVIAANNSSMPEVAGIEADYFETNNSKQLAALMSQRQEPEACSLATKERARNFTWDKHLDQLMNIISNL